MILTKNELEGLVGNAFKSNTRPNINAVYLIDGEMAVATDGHSMLIVSYSPDPSKAFRDYHSTSGGAAGSFTLDSMKQVLKFMPKDHMVQFDVQGGTASIYPETCWPRDAQIKIGIDRMAANYVPVDQVVPINPGEPAGIVYLSPKILDRVGRLMKRCGHPRSPICRVETWGELDPVKISMTSADGQRTLTSVIMPMRG